MSKSKSPKHPAPRTRDEANAFIGQIGAAQRERARLQAEMNDQIAGIKAKFDDKAQPLADDIAARVQGVQSYCQANRAALTRNGAVQFHRFSFGDVNWRRRPPKVGLRGVAPKPPPTGAA